MNDDTIKCVAAIAGIVLIEIVALLNGIDGVLLSATIAVIAGLGGYALRPKIEEIKELWKAEDEWIDEVKK